MSIKRDFEQRLNAIKEQAHEDMEKLSKRYVNMKNWEIRFKYDWSMTCKSSIDKDSNYFETDDAISEQTETKKPAKEWVDSSEEALSKLKRRDAHQKQKEINNQQTPVSHSHTEKEKGRRVSEKVVASRIGESILPDANIKFTNQKETVGVKYE